MTKNIYIFLKKYIPQIELFYYLGICNKLYSYIYIHIWSILCNLDRVKGDLSPLI